MASGKINLISSELRKTRKALRYVIDPRRLLRIAAIFVVANNSNVCVLTFQKYVHYTSDIWGLHRSSYLI